MKNRILFFKTIKSVSMTIKCIRKSQNYSFLHFSYSCNSFTIEKKVEICIPIEMIGRRFSSFRKKMHSSTTCVEALFQICLFPNFIFFSPSSIRCTVKISTVITHTFMRDKISTYKRAMTGHSLFYFCVKVTTVNSIGAINLYNDINEKGIKKLFFYHFNALC